jgi:hypothetical protein
MQVTKSRDLLEKVLERNAEGYLDFCGMDVLKNEIKEHLAQPDHIPDVGSMVERINWLEDQLKQIEQDSPPKPEPLSDAEIYELDDEVNGFVGKNVVRAVMRWIRAVEREHGIGVDDE